ncbi:MAG: metallophosphoesterase family protein [Bryobacterales bacterium]|nr:metallophosphoesterase family protein [Bryobacterales bacterium]
MLRRSLTVSVFTGLLFFGYFQISQAQKDGKVPDAQLHKPTPFPDRVILTWSGDPATSQAVTWRTDATVTAALAEIAEAGDGPDFVKQAKKINARTEPLKTDLSLAHCHSVEFTGLNPGTMYAYRVGDGFNWSEWNQFRTASAKPAPLEFIYVGDAQNDLYSLWSRLIRQAYSDAPKMRFIVHAGDLINRAERDAEWGEWHQAAGWINRSVPSFPVPGNHEYGRQVEGKKANTVNWRPQFTLPGNGVPGLEETNYYIDIQGVRMIALNSNERQQEQAEWLDKLLASNTQRWVIATFHHPIYSAARSRDNKALREVWQPVFDKHAVDLVMTGHDHTYARTNLMTGVNAQTGKNGTVYVVSVSGPKMYGLDRNPTMQRSAEDTQLFQIVRVDGDMLSYQAHTARGVLYDAFELKKRSGKSNQLVNKVPNTPERRRGAEAKAAD